MNDIQFVSPPIIAEDIELMKSSITSGWLVPGEFCASFENQFGTYVGSSQLLMTNSATSAIGLIFDLLGLGPDDEVISPAINWVSVVNECLRRGIKPILADTDPNSGLILEESVLSQISSRTKVVFWVNLYGLNFSPSRSFVEFLSDRNIYTAADCAHAIETSRFQLFRPDFKVYSFHAAKNITCGQGGALELKQEQLFFEAKRYIRHGIEFNDNKRSWVSIGTKMQISDYQAALLIGQLRRIQDLWGKRREVFLTYADFFGRSGVTYVNFQDLNQHSFHLFSILVPADSRDSIRFELQKKGIPTSIHYRAISDEPNNYFSNIKLPYATKFGREQISLPTHSNLSNDQLVYIAEKVSELLNY